MRTGKFREDLFYRLNGVALRLPPLRARLKDVPELCRSILERMLKSRASWQPKTFSDAALAKLMTYSWLGNIRQLHNKIEGAMILSGERKSLEPEDFTLEQQPLTMIRGGQGSVGNVHELPTEPSDSALSSSAPNFNLRNAKHRFEQKLIERALQHTAGNKTEAAKLLGITREGLRKAMLKKIAA